MHVLRRAGHVIAVVDGVDNLSAIKGRLAEKHKMVNFQYCTCVLPNFAVRR